MTPLLRYYCISLPDCTERRQAMEKQAETAKIDLVFIDAVDGRENMPDLTGHQLKTGTWDWKGHQLSGTQVGCLLSHRDALTTFLNSQADYAVVFEDDASFGAKIAEHLHELLNLQGWDLIKIENRYRKRRGFHITRTSWGAEVIAGTKSDIGTTGLLWTRNGAEKCLRSLKILTLPFDVHLAHYPATSIRLLDLLPPLVKQSELGKKSNISTENKNSQLPDYRKRSLQKVLGQSVWSLYRNLRAFQTKLRVSK